MSAVATPAPMRRVGPVRRLVRSLRPVAGLLRPSRALFAGGVATNLMVHLQHVPAYADRKARAAEQWARLTPFLYLLPAYVAGYAALAGAADRRALAAIALLGASFAVWAFLFQTKEDYHALAKARAGAVLLPAKLYAALALLFLSPWIVRFGRICAKSEGIA